MSILENYGELELPGEKSVVEVVEDPSKTISSCYEAFIHWVKKSGKCDLEEDWEEFFDIEDGIEELYQRATKILEGKEKLKYSSKDLKNIFELTKPDRNNYHILLSGIFLSALHNNAGSDLLYFDDKNKLITYLGYHLKSNKKLILGPKTFYDFTGINNKGNIINFGFAGNLGFDNSDGVIINYGHIIQDLGNQSIGGIVINNNFVKDFGNYAKKGICINVGVIDKFKCEESDKTGEQIAINLGFVIENEYEFTKKNVDLKQINHESILNLRSKLEDKLKEAECLEKLNQISEEEVVKIVSAFDFNKFKQDIAKLSKEIQGEYYNSRLHELD